MERTSVVELPGGQDLGSLFSDLIRLETELWDLVDTRLRREHGLALSWFELMQVIDSTPGCRVVDIAEALSITITSTPSCSCGDKAAKQRKSRATSL